MRGRVTEGLVNAVIGKNIKSIRNDKNLNRTDIGRILGVSYQQIQKYENGKNRISASNLFLLSQSLHIPIEDFFIGIAVHFEGKNT